MRDHGDRDTVAVSATEFIISETLAPVLLQLYEASPSIAVVLRSEAALVSLAGRDADIAVRMSRPQGNSLFAKKLPEQRLGLFASEAYLGGGDPTRLELRSERLLVYDDSYGRLPELDWLSSAELEGQVAMRTGSTRSLATATRAGAGIGLLPLWAARAEELVRVPDPVGLPSRSPWLVVHRDLRQVPAIRASHAWIVKSFGFTSSHSARV